MTKFLLKNHKRKRKPYTITREKIDSISSSIQSDKPITKYKIYNLKNKNKNLRFQNLITNKPKISLSNRFFKNKNKQKESLTQRDKKCKQRIKTLQKVQIKLKKHMALKSNGNAQMKIRLPQM